MTTPAPKAPCRALWPQAAGVYCTRPKGHQGGHLDEVRDIYWQAAVTS